MQNCSDFFQNFRNLRASWHFISGVNGILRQINCPKRQNFPVRTAARTHAGTHAQHPNAWDALCTCLTACTHMCRGLGTCPAPTHVTCTRLTTHTGHAHVQHPHPWHAHMHRSPHNAVVRICGAHTPQRLACTHAQRPVHLTNKCPNNMASHTI